MRSISHGLNKTILNMSKYRKGKFLEESVRATFIHTNKQKQKQKHKQIIQMCALPAYIVR